MALDATTVAANSIDHNSANLRGSWTQDNSTCCDAPPCSYAARFYYGTSDPPGTLVSAGSSCDAGYCDGGANSFNKVKTGLTQDTTYYFRASITTASLGGSCDANCSGGCGGSNNGTVLNFRTCAGDVEFGAVSAGTPGQTSVTVLCEDVDPNVVEGTATVKVQYKLDTEPTVWTDGGSRNANRAGPADEEFTITGLTGGSLYDFRFTVTRSVSCGDASDSSAEGQFTTAASSVPITPTTETPTWTDAFSLTLTGQAVAEEEEVGIVEEVDLVLQTTDEETFVGVWFYHFPTRSYWFWNWDNFTAAINDTDGDDRARLFVALGSEVYIGDDEEYYFDDRNQRRPIADSTGSEIELSVVPRTIDLGGVMGRVRELECKWGAPPEISDPLGNVDIGLLSDVYPKKPIPPNARRVLAERRAAMSDEYTGLVEWRRYAAPRVRLAGTLGVRFSWPTGEHPKRVAPVEIESIKLNVVTNGRKRRNI